MLRYKTETRSGLVALYDIRPGNGAGPFLQRQSSHGACQRKVERVEFDSLPVWTGHNSDCSSALFFVRFVANHTRW